jgi:hypothetical protein
MTTENQNPEAIKKEDDEVPYVARYFGFAVSEWVTYGFIVVSVGAVIFGNVVGSERDVQAERAMDTLAALTEAAEIRFAATGPLACDNSLLSPELLVNEYLSLSINPAPINEDNKSLGYGPALSIDVVEKEVSGDTWDTAKRLVDLVKEAGKEEAKAAEALADRDIADNVAVANEAEEDTKPQNRLRELREKGFGEDEEYLRYHILASETAICS